VEHGNMQLFAVQIDMNKEV